MMKRNLYLILCMAVVALFAVYGIDRSKPPGGRRWRGESA